MIRSTTLVAILVLAAAPLLAQDEDPNARFRSERERLEAEYLAADRAGDVAGKRAALRALESLTWEERRGGRRRTGRERDDLEPGFDRGEVPRSPRRAADRAGSLELGRALRFGRRELLQLLRRGREEALDRAEVGAAGWDAYEDMFAETMDGAAPTFSIRSGSEIEIVYELADPEDHVVSAVRDYVDRGVVPSPSSIAEDAFVQEVERHGEIVLVERETGSFGIGGAGEVGAETQKVGLGLGVEGATTSEREVWRKSRDGKK